MSNWQDDLAFFKRYALTCTYLRGRLNVPKINLPSDRVATERSDDMRPGKVKLLPPPLSNATAADPIDQVIQRDPLAVLATLLKYSVGQLRWEPRNPSRLHAAVPRPGGGPFCTRLRLSVPSGDGRATVWGYEPQGHSLYFVANEDSDIGSVQLSIHSDPGRIASGYGDLSLTLALLEAGHCYQQLFMLMAAMNLPPTWAPGPSGESEYEGNGQLSIGRFSLDLGDLASELEGRPEADALIGWSHPPSDYQTRFPLLKRAAQTLDQSGEAVADLHAAKAAWDLPRLLAASRRRTSGLQGDGFVPKRVLDVDGLKNVLTEWTTLASPQQSSAQHPLRMFLAVTCIEGMAPQITEYDLVSRQLVLPRELDAATILRPHIGLGAGYNFDEFSFTLLVTCPLLAKIDDEGPSAYRSALLEGGAVAQALLLALAEKDMFGRPFRAISEAALETKFGLEDPIIYAVLCGRDRLINLTYPM